MARTAANYYGQRFGRLLVCGMGEPYRYPNGKIRPRVRCICSCGEVCEALVIDLQSGHTKSCGCLAREQSAERAAQRIIHGMRKSRVYGIWQGMLDRCRNPKHDYWDYYGGRGIKVCERWQIFQNFYADMGDPPDGYSIDRIDNDQGYSKDNCRWATKEQQAQNRRPFARAKQN